MSFSWTDDTVEDLKDRWRRGEESAREIAESLGTTRNAVLGKLSRLGLLNQVGPRPPKPARRRESIQVAGSEAPVLAPPKDPDPEPWRDDAAPQDLSFPEPDEPDEPDEPREGATILDLRRDSCRWPIGDPQRPGFHFCGLRTAKDKPYCVEHLEQAFVAAPARRRAS